MVLEEEEREDEEHGWESKVNIYLAAGVNGSCPGASARRGPGENHKSGVLLC